MILSATILGSGDPLIILHGLFGDSKNWNSIAKELSSDFEVHLIDQRNHGNSFHHPEHNYEVLANDLHHYINKYSLKHYSIIGHSMGGKVAMQFSFMCPDELQNLIIVDIAPKEYENEHSEILEGLQQVVLESNSRKEAQNILMHYVKDMTVVNFLLKGFYISDEKKPKFKFNLQALEKNITNLLGPLKKHNTFNGRTYFLSGSESNYIQPSDSKDISKLFPRNKIITINNAGHWIHFEAKESFLRTIKTILK